MIFVDTSVWIAAFRSGTSAEARHLEALLDEDQVALSSVVRLEILAGASANQFDFISRSLSALPIFFPERETWDRVDSWIRIAVSTGERFGITDLLIAATAAVNRSAIWSLDGDFERMKRKKFVELHDQ